MDDEVLAKAYCVARGFRYLSHEVYGDMLAIAVEGDGERWEERVSRDIAHAQVALADFDKNGGTSLEDLRKELDI